MDKDNRELEEKIIDLEKEINDIKVSNGKKRVIKNLKISKTAMHRVAPYVLSCGIIAGTLKLAGVGFPFVMDDIKKCADVKSEFDASGRLIKNEKIYGSYEMVDESRINRLIIYSKWNKIDNNKYERNVTSYRLDKKDLSYVLSLGNIEELNVENILGIPYMSQVETRYNVNNIDNKNGYIRVIVYNKDKNDYVMIKEPIGDNIGISCLYILLCLLSILGIGIYRNSFSKFDYDYEVSKIKLDYYEDDITELEEELERKKRELKR